LQQAFAKTAVNFLSHKDHAGIYDKNPHKNAAIFYKKTGYSRDTLFRLAMRQNAGLNRQED
jgi:hypothetical protein